MLDQATRLREMALLLRRGERLLPRAHIITVTSGKGGVGKSTISLNLSLQLCAMGKKVVLIDADANLGNLDIMLDVSPRYRLSHVLRGEVDVEDVLISPLEGLRVLPAGSGEPDYPSMTAERQQQLVDDLMRMEDRFDLLVIDTGAGLNAEIIGFAELADETIVISSPDPTAVMDAYAFMKVFWTGKPNGVVRLLVNEARTPGEADEVASKLRMAVTHFLKRELVYVGSIPFDPAVQKAVLRQEPLVAAFPRSAAALSLRVLAQHIVRSSSHGAPNKRTSL
jgi:flagellar biosynthesis protein FlhG